MNTFVQRLSSNWTLIQSGLVAGLTLVAGLVWWVMRLGGKQRLLAWIVELESSEQEDAAQRVSQGLNAVQAQGGTSKACFDFIGGLDQWRTMQTRITQRHSQIHRSGYPICVFITSAVAALIVGIFESSIRTWSALCVGGAIIGAAWLLWNIVPLIYVAWLNGLPQPAKDLTAATLAKSAAAAHQKTPPSLES
jgi:hypothetical protein